MRYRLEVVLCLFWISLGQSASLAAESVPKGATALVYFNEVQLAGSKAAIASRKPEFLAAYQQLLGEGDALLSMNPDPVVNKTIVPPSGDSHDYLSYAPYRWPDETKAEGRPWKARDGKVNPVSRGPDTDWVRLQNLLSAVEKLSFAFYFSGDAKYAEKTLELLNVWFISPETRVNTNFRFSQSIPGLAHGNPAGFIDWRTFSRVITAVEILEHGGALPPPAKIGMNAWFEAYLEYLLTSKQGKETNALRQNHATWYSYQVVGLMIHLGRFDEAKAKVEDVKSTRIATQIRPNGEQPLEMGRTRSIHYSATNLWALTKLTFMGRNLGVDLWTFESEDGNSLPGAYQYLEPFARFEKPWPFKEISPDGVEAAIHTYMRPLFRNASVLLKLDEFEWCLMDKIERTPLETLQYPVLKSSYGTEATEKSGASGK